MTGRAPEAAGAPPAAGGPAGPSARRGDAPPLAGALRALATLGPVGRVPLAPGTAGSLVALAAWLALARLPLWALGAATVGLIGLGVAASAEVARRRGLADPPEVVIDEAAGMALALLLAPGGLGAGLAAFAAFRLFDVAKPFPVGRLERLPRGWGIVADDLAAALFAAGAVRLAWRLSGLG